MTKLARKPNGAARAGDDGRSSARCSPVAKSVTATHLETIDQRLARIEQRLSQVVSAVEERLHKLDGNVDARADADTERILSRRNADTVHDAAYATADAKHASRAPKEHALDCDLQTPCSCGASTSSPPSSTSLETVK